MLLKMNGNYIKYGGNLLSVSDIHFHRALYLIKDVYSMVGEGDRFIIVTRHAERGSDTSITGDLNSNGINQCKTLGNSLFNANIDLSKTYIGGSHKYRALNTAYQCTKAMGVVYPSGFNYLTDVDQYDELMEVNFFMDSKGESSGIDLSVNAYYSFVDDTIYNGANKVEDHVNTKSKELIDLMISKSEGKDLAWFGTHDKVIIPLLAYVMGKTPTIHRIRTNSDVTIAMKNPITGKTSGNWSIPLLSGIAFIISKTTVDVYPVECGFT